MVGLRRASGPVREIADSEQLRPRWRNLIAGLLLVLLSGVLGFVAWQARGEQVEVWAARERLAAGTTLSNNDLRLARVVVQADSVRSSMRTSTTLDGRTLRIDVARDGLLTADQFLPAGDVFERADVSVVGLSLGSDQAPATLAAGDIVDLYLIDGDSTQSVIEGVRVLSVDRHSSGAALAVAEILDADTETVLLAAARGQVLVAITGRS